MSQTGTELIRSYVRNLPNRPGVYRMLDAQFRPLYVGKARDLKQRVTNYTHLRDKPQRLCSMIEQTAQMEFIETSNEAEALLLEANLIKQLKPRYNVLLRDDKSYPQLLLTDHPFPRLQKHRGAQDTKGHYFGPYASAGDVNKVIKQLQRVFLLRPCSDSYFTGRSRPCLQYQIKRCSAPCVGAISADDYGNLVTQAIAFLKGESQNLQQKMQEEMLAASEVLDYERAAILRNRLRALTQIQQGQKLHAPSLKEADVIALYRESNEHCLQVFFFRDGQNFGNVPFYPKAGMEQSEAEIIAAFLPYFYQNRTPPRQILVSHLSEEAETLEQALSQIAGHRITLSHPLRGEKKEILLKVERNAKLALHQRIQQNASQSEMLEKIAELFNLPAPPERIEVYDNSHISGSHAVGGMIVSGESGFEKKHYRKFNIKEAQTDDDFAMMREVMRRRLKSFTAPDADPEQIIPLLLIDGGLGQLSSVKQVMQEMGLWEKIPVVAISKGVDRNAGREQFHIDGKPSFQLPMNDPRLHYLQRLRDEAHRFAIGTHRARRSSALKRSQLDEISGIGPARKKALLQHFGSARAVANASREDIASVPGINAKTAEIIWREFHS